MEMEQQNKVVQLNEDLLENEEEVKVDDGGDNELSDVDKLPPEILMKILDYLDEQELVKCRILSSRWNGICSLLLQDKTNKNPHSKLAVVLGKPRKGLLSIKTVIKKSLNEFLDCFAMTQDDILAGRHRRRPFPFSRFSVSGLYYMEKNQMTKFVSLFVHIKKLDLNIKKQDFDNFGKFWRLLLKFAPNIEHLRLLGEHWPGVDLFEPYLNFKANYDPFENVGGSDKTQIIYETFLNKLKIFEAKPPLFVYSLHQDSIDIFLEHAPNVQELIDHPRIGETGNNTFKLILLWQKLNRAHLLKKLEIKSTSKSYYSPAELMKNLQLEKLRVDCDLENEKSLTNYIYHALKSSQNTLATLNLDSLSVESMNLCFKDISSLSNVYHLELLNIDLCEVGPILHRFSQLCPNTEILNLGFIEGDFSRLVQILWIRFKGLKSLKLILSINRCQVYLRALDSAFSGYSQESIQRIYEKLEGGMSLEEAREGELQQNPSILNLKDLSRLELEFYMDGRTEEMEQVQDELENSVFVQMLPQHIREYPRSIVYRYFD